MLMKIVVTMLTAIKRTKIKTRSEVEEEQFIQTANSLKTLRVPLGGCMSIDPEEFRDQIIAAREQYKSLVRRDE